MAERLGSFGYFAGIKEANKGVPQTPTFFAPMYKQSVSTDIVLTEIIPAVGNKFARYAVVPGQRNHKGTFTIMAEPDSAAYFMDMLYTQGAASGAGPYTHPFTLSSTVNPKSYTIDVSTGNLVFRYYGFEASAIVPVWNGNEMQLQVTGSALGAFSTREIATITPGTPNIITLKTDYDRAPNKGLVAGDLIVITKVSDGSLINCTVTASTGVNADGITITCDQTLTAIAAGDLVSLRPQSPTYGSLVTNPFLWSNTEFHIGATATLALAQTSAQQTRVEQSSTWSLMHKFESDNGAERSGGFDPAALVRTLGDVDSKIKKFFDSAVEVNNFIARKNQALVIRHFVYAGANTYEFRITIDQYVYQAGGKPPVESGKIIYHAFDLMPVWNTTNGEGLSITVINTLATV